MPNRMQSWIIGFGAIVLLGSVTPSTARYFTIAEEAIIERNEALRLVYEKDPALVRRVLDSLAKRPASKEKQRDPFARTAPADHGPTSRDPASLGPQIDPGANPDLAIYQRGSPEAAHDLFQLLKRAASRP